MRYRFRRNRVRVGAMDDEWKADLVIMDSLSQQNSWYKYVLTVIDILSKYAWVEAIKAKTGNSLVKALDLWKGRRTFLLKRKLRVPILQISMVDFPTCMSTLISLMHSLSAM